MELDFKLRTESRLLLNHIDLQAHIQKSKAEIRRETTVAFKAAELMKVAHFHLSLKNVQHFFAELLKRQCCLIWEGPTNEGLMRALMIATSHSTSFDRNHPTCFINSTQNEILAQMAGKLAGKGCVDTRTQIISEAMKGISAHLHSRHLGLPRTIPSKLVDLYKEETGRDIAETWQLDRETCLSPIACCFPACDLYLTIPPGDDKKKRSVIRDHLRSCCQNSIPGLHRCVARHRHLPTAEIIPLVESGAELGEPFLPREVTRRLAKGVSTSGGIPRQFTSAEKYKEHALQVEYNAMPGRMKVAIKEFTGGDSAALYHAIDDLKISFEEDTWSYSAFKRTFDAKYEALDQSRQPVSDCMTQAFQ